MFLEGKACKSADREVSKSSTIAYFNALLANKNKTDRPRGDVGFGT